MSLVNSLTGRGPQAPEIKKFDVQVECKVCGCITLDSGMPDCWGCHWPLSDVGSADAFGHEALVRFPQHLGGDKPMKRVGPLSRLRSVAKSKGGKVIAVRSLTRKQWIDAYGNPEERGL